MAQKIVSLGSREELEVYMSPVRQELLRILRLAGGPMTAKALGDRLRISASSAQHHIKKLQDLGLLEVDHRAAVNGINATYFRLADVEVHVGMGLGDGLREEREALVSRTVGHSLQGFFKLARSLEDADPEELRRRGNLFTGVMNLTPGEREALMETVQRFLTEHDAFAPERTEHWEIVVLAYRPEAEP